MHQIPDSCVALKVTSPPYNCGKDYDQDLDLDEFMAMLESVITETFRVLELGGRVAINVADLGRKPYIPLHHHIAALLVDVGFRLRGEIIWQKAKGASGSTAWGTWQSIRSCATSTSTSSSPPRARSGNSPPATTRSAGRTSWR